MDIITEIEGDARELYCGATAALGFEGDLDTSIAIRTVFMDGHKVVLQAGGGVTLLSEPTGHTRGDPDQGRPGVPGLRNRILASRIPGRGGRRDPRHRQLRQLRLQRGALLRGIGRDRAGGAQRPPRRGGHPRAGAGSHRDLARPCTPAEAGISLPAIRELSGQVPLLGVCLGHQAIGAAFGGRVTRAGRPLHGQATPIRHDGTGLFAGLPDPMQVRALPPPHRGARTRGMDERLHIERGLDGRGR